MDTITPLVPALTSNQLDFPANPNVGDVFMGWTWDGTKWIRTPVIPPAQLMVYIGSSPPSTTAPGFLWWDDIGGNLYIYYTDPNTSQWVTANVGVMGPTGAQGPPGPAVPTVNIQPSVPTAADLPTSGNAINDARITTDTGDLWIWDGTIWFNAGQIQGPPGPAGETGAQGPAGPPGPVGEAPTDGNMYLRQGSTASWVSGGTLSGVLTLNGADPNNNSLLITNGLNVNGIAAFWGDDNGFSMTVEHGISALGPIQANAALTSYSTTYNAQLNLWSTTAWTIQSEFSTGVCSWFNGVSTVMFVDPSGNFTTSGVITQNAGGQNTFGAHLQINGSDGSAGGYGLVTWMTNILVSRNDENNPIVCLGNPINTWQMGIWGNTPGWFVWQGGPGEGGGATRMNIDGNGNCFNTDGTWSAISDPRLKRDVTNYQSGLNEILKLQPIRYHLNGGAEGVPNESGDMPLHIGLDATAVQGVLPELVKPTQLGAARNQYQGVNVGALVFALINAVKELNTKLEALK